MRRLLIVLGALIATAVGYLLFTLPPRAVQLGGIMPPTVALGGYHIHSTRSDGTGTVDEIAAAADRAGLSFIVLTDHGDGTRVPDRPQYRHGVLCIDAVEIGTLGGHLVALNISVPAPYPLSGEAADVIEDIHRLGGAAVIAHPDSPKAGLQWKGPVDGADGIEWLNADSEWRDETNIKLVTTVGRYFFRPAEAAASLFARPTESLRRWDESNVARPVFALAALDAHGGLMTEDAVERRRIIAWPTYEALFRALAQAVVLEAPLTRVDANAGADAGRVLAALIGGRSFSIVRANATPASLNFSASMENTIAHMGDRVASRGASVSFRSAVPQAPTAHLVLFRNGTQVASGEGSVTFAGNAKDGAYRVAGFLGASVMPWIISNPIYVGPAASTPAVVKEPAPKNAIPLPVGGSWGIEKDATSSWDVQRDGREWRWIFGLGDGAPAGQYSAIVSSIDDTLDLSRLMFTARSSQPLRVSVQVRLPTGERWRRSIYLDTTPRQFDLPLREFVPVTPASATPHASAHVRGILFVVDTLNTAPGTRGTVWIEGVGASGNR